MNLPLIDIAPLFSQDADPTPVAASLREACEEVGFFYVVGHGIDPELEKRVETLARDFFALPVEEKLQIDMKKGGTAWRGYFPVGGELTSGAPDQKEGIYFGEEIPLDDPRNVRPLHGQNLWPAQPIGLREAVTDYMSALTRAGHALMRGLSVSLNLPPDYFYDHYTREPVILFRIFNYPPSEQGWGVGEHTDYGVLTLLKQDGNAGLEVKAKSGWISAPPLPGSMVCNIGDMLDRMTGGRYRSTPHRVRNLSGKSRLSFPFFFDPGWDAEVLPLPGVSAVIREERWDRADVHEFRGRYGDYLRQKVSKVFPELASLVVEDRS